MENWLKKYPNGGEINNNNSNVKIPPDFVGMGNNTQGRNYSSAWGGQFENGGESKKRNVQSISPELFEYPNASREERRAHTLFPYPTPNDLQLQNTKALSDSAQFVQGYRSPKTIQEMWPDELQVGSPLEGGYLTKIFDEKRQKELPGKVNFLTGKIKKKENGGELQKLDQLTNFNNFGQNKKWLSQYNK